ncbi:MAG: hypothetical protein IZT59_03535 [Verrucomicrobia bacterium]|jgi:hypothetical protein|nr:hypothetical protein [Verrucomicrobiota bacterium]|tara:strand:+ start:8550 stop:10877 length:2328 start_codon:yes stop_codon:yes gene_type:complete
MKFKYSACCVVSAVVLGGVSCKEKPKSVESGETENKSVAENVVDAVKEAVTGNTSASLSADERAAKLGFSKYLPKDAEMVFSVFNAEQAGEHLKALEIYGIIEKNVGMGMGGGFEPEIEIEEEMLEDEAPVPLDAEQAPEDGDFEQGEMEGGPSPWALLGQEVTIGFGKTSAEQTGHLLTLSRRMGYFQAKALGRAAQAYGKTGNMDDFSDTIVEEMGEELMTSLLEDSQSGTGLLEKAVMPPLYFAFRAKDGELEQAAQLVNSGMSFFGMAEDMAEPVTFERAGAEFSGYKLIGAKVAEVMEAERESMEETIGVESTDALIGAIAKKNLFVVTGTIDNYVVVMVGGDEESLTLATTPSDSILGTDELAFSDAFADKQMLALAYGGKDVWDTLVKQAGMLAPYALGLRDGISGGDGLGDTRDLEGMFQIVSDREKALLALGKASDMGMVAYTEEGLKIETFGSYDNGSVNWDADTTLAHLGDSGDNLLFMNVASDAVYEEKMLDYVEAIVETAYAATVQLSSLDVDAPELAGMKQFTKLFDEQFRDDMLGLYVAISGDFSEGLGNESAIVIDLKGSVPAIPGLPQEVVNEGKAPRISLIAPVTDRAKLASAWTEINTRAISILGKVSEMSEKEIPMPKRTSSESNGAKTWYYQMPFFDDNFMPSVTVSDNWFAASTSKTQALELIGKAEAGGKTGKGLQFYLNFTALTQYADEMLAMVDKNSAAIFTSEYELKGFNRSKGQIKEVIDACKEFDSMTWISAKENGMMHSTMHFKTK